MKASRVELVFPLPVGPVRLFTGRLTLLLRVPLVGVRALLPLAFDPLFPLPER
ncbi:MAG TPA: hypothetical protein VLM83_01820 [Anaerolineales bacterium]|nr:hypothetical protein [Anaerolineales bacterium]